MDCVILEINGEMASGIVPHKRCDRDVRVKYWHGRLDPVAVPSSSTDRAMILNATLKSDDKVTTIPIPVGNGDHDFKWLALAVSEHLAQQSSFMLKQRNHLIGHKDLISKCRLRPKDIYTDTISFFHPDALIKDHLADGDNITVELYSSNKPLQLDEYHQPNFSIWSSICFGISEANANDRDRLIKDKMAQLEQERQQREELALERRLNWERPRIACMTTILERQLLDQEEMEASARREWSLIVGSGKIDNIVKGEEEKAKCCEIFVQNYHALCELYKDFSVVNTGGDMDNENNGSHQTLEFIEFSKLLFDCKISLSSAVMQKLFVESSFRGQGKVAGTGIEKELDRVEFFLSLIKIATYKFIALRRREQSMLRRKGHSKAISHATTPSPSEALQMLYDENLRPVLATMPVARVKQALALKETMLLFYEHVETLVEVFNTYAKKEEGADLNASSESRTTARNTDSSDMSPPPGTMSGADFLSLARDANFLHAGSAAEANEGNDHSMVTTCTPLDVRKSFAASRNDDVVSDEGVTFCEFLEAIARLGIITFCSQSSDDSCSDEVTIIDCIRRTLGALQ